MKTKWKATRKGASVLHAAERGKFSLFVENYQGSYTIMWSVFYQADRWGGSVDRRECNIEMAKQKCIDKADELSTKIPR